MSIEQTNILDTIGIDNVTDKVTLFIDDSTNWDDEKKHVFLLQEKTNMYLSFIESGEVFETYPKAVGKKGFEIKIYFKYDVPELGLEFLKKASEIIEAAGFSLTYILYSDMVK